MAIKVSGFTLPINVPRATRTTTRLVAIADSTVWHESGTAGTMVELAVATATLTTTDEVAIFEAFGKVYLVNDKVFKVIDFVNVKLSTADLRNPLDTSHAVPDRGIILTGGTSGATLVLDYIDAVDGATLLYGFRTSVATFDEAAETVTGTNADGDGVSFVLNALPVAPTTPHYYDWTPYGNDTTTYGSMPVRATLGILYRGRAVLSGDIDNPHQWYMSRQINPYDWNYTTLDAQSAVAGSNADAGEIGDAVKALIPYKDDYLLFGCFASIWRMNGDPAAGGRLVEVSLTTGIFGPKSWAFDDEENLYFVGSGSVFLLPPQVGMTPKDLTQELLPDFWTDWALDASLHAVIMAYDKLNHGILVNRTLLTDGANKNYWIDTRTKGFFPESYPADAGIYSSYYYSVTDPALQSLILGTRGSYLREFDLATKTDDAGITLETINSFVVFGPLLAAQSGESNANLTQSSHTLTTDTDSVVSSIFVHNTSEKLIEGIDDGTLNPVFATTIKPTTRPVRHRRRARGPWFAARLQNKVNGETWGLESFTINVEPSGRF